MGYWAQDVRGHSFAESDEYVWGDQLADIMDEALDRMVAQYETDVTPELGRKPRKGELLAGILFSFGALSDRIEDDGVAAVLVNQEAANRLAELWRDGVSDEQIVAVVRDLFHGLNGELALLSSLR